MSTGGSSASGGYGAVEFGSGRYAAWAGVGSVGGTTSMKVQAVYRVPVQTGVRVTGQVGLVRGAARGEASTIVMGGGGVMFGSRYGGRVSLDVGRRGGSTVVSLQAGGFVGF